MTYETWDYVMHFDVYSEFLENIFEGKSLEIHIQSAYNLFQKKIHFGYASYQYLVTYEDTKYQENWVNGTIDMLGHGNNMCQLTWITCFTFEWDLLHYICSKWHIMSFDVLSAK